MIDKPGIFAGGSGGGRVKQKNLILLPR